MAAQLENVKVGTVKSKYSNAVTSMEFVREVLSMAGKTPVQAAGEQVMAQYLGQMIEMSDGSLLEMNAANFEDILSTESDRLAEKANILLDSLRVRVVPLLAQLTALWDEANEILGAENEKLALPELPTFTVKVGRRGGGGGGGKVVARDWSADEYTHVSGYQLVVESRKDGEPVTFAVLDPNGEFVAGNLESAAAGKNVVCEALGMSTAVNAPRFWKVPAAE